MDYKRNKMRLDEFFEEYPDEYRNIAELKNRSDQIDSARKKRIAERLAKIEKYRNEG